MTLTPLGSQALAALMENSVTVPSEQWLGNNGKARMRNDSLSKVCGSKVFARDIRDIRDIRAVTAEDLDKDGIVFPEDHAPDPLLPTGKVSMFIGHPVAILIWNDFERFRQAKNLLKFNDKAIRYGAEAPFYTRDPYGSFRYVRVGGATSADEDEFASLKDSILFPMIRERRPVWNAQPNLHGNLTERGLFYAERMQPMPGFADKLSHQQTTDLINYLRQAWGGQLADLLISQIEQLKADAPAEQKAH